MAGPECRRQIDVIEQMKPRLKNHVVLTGATVVGLGTAALAGPAAAAPDRLSIVSAYLCLLLLGAALLIGPAEALRTGRAPANSYVRRDVGIWAALNGLLHFFLANVLAMNYEYLGIFVETAAAPPSAEVRGTLYGWGTITGYLIAVVFVVLLVISSDRMLRKIGLKWWKRIQRFGYAGFALTCLHAFAFQWLESREALWIGIVTIVMALVMVGQALGIGRIRKTVVAERPERYVRTP